MTAAWTRLFAGWRLSTRLVVLSLLLLLALQLAGLMALRASIERNARAELSERLAVGERIWARLLEQRAAKLGQAATLLAADYAFRDALTSGDDETIESALDNHGARIDAALSALLDTRLAVRRLARAEDPAQRAARVVLSALAPRLAERGSAVAMVGDKAYQFVMVPVRAPLVIGWVAMGFELDRALVDDLHAVSGMRGRLLAVAADGAERVLAGSTPADAGTAAAPQLERRVAVSGDARPGVVLQLAGSLDEAVQPYRALQWTMVAITLLGLVLFGIGSAWTARRVTRPLRGLVRASLRLGRGEYDVPIEHAGGSDEVGELARAFDAMRGNIAVQQQEIRQLAYWDRLTGLPNRAQFRDAVIAAIGSSDAEHQSLAVIMLDLDRFKHVNDVLGYGSGDRLLQGVAARLQVVVRGGDLVARLGGDEFALLLAGADAATAQEVAARIGKAFETPLTLDDQTVDLSAGLGIACWPAHGADADTLLSRAEVAMYAAKRRTAGAQLYEPALDNASGETLSLLSELRQAVEGGQLRLFLQPKVLVASGTLCGAEALVRWQHPTRGLVPPMQFIPFAEQTGFIRQLTLWIFGEVARHQAALAAMGVAKVSINLSTRDLLDVELPEKLDVILALHRASARGLCLEITESAIMDDPERAEATLHRLAERGFKLSIDDFGTGYSSLAYLKRLPVHELKIDKSFVMAMGRDASDAKIVRSTIDLAHGLGLTVVAEGVESAGIQSELAALRCDEAQGYHLSRPLPIDAFAAWVSERALQTA
ncbi:MAG TPA: EAL domain-containing protein [Burkholderiaceae bacterium]|nr:EAL domain-containing protein [Burkholderiaceae bacterium]